MASIIIPSSEDRITKGDITNTLLRISPKFMSYFPNKDHELTLIINRKEFRGSLDVKNKHGEDASYLLHLGKEGMEELNVQEGECVEITKIGENTYEVSRMAFEEQTRRDQRAFMMKFAPK